MNQQYHMMIYSFGFLVLFYFSIYNTLSTVSGCPLQSPRSVIFYYTIVQKNDLHSMLIRYELEKYRNDLLGYGVKLYYVTNKEGEDHVECCFNDKCSSPSIRFYDNNKSIIRDIPLKSVFHMRFLRMIDKEQTLHTMNSYLESTNDNEISKVYSPGEHTVLIGIFPVNGYEKHVLNFYRIVNCKNDKKLKEIADYFVYVREDRSYSSLHLLSYIGHMVANRDGHKQPNHNEPHYYLHSKNEMKQVFIPADCIFEFFKKEKDVLDNNENISIK